ncbi:hypothetical protein [Marinicella litoralis]|nr:hypothetical protein [Marinicella litoralis]
MADHDMPSSQSLIANDLHAGHDMSTMDMKPDMQNDCCDTDCQCAQNTCSGSSPMINNSMNSVFNLNHHASFSNEHKIIYYQATSALFRPPIIC